MHKVDIQKITITSNSTVQKAMQVIGEGRLGFVIVLDVVTSKFLRVLTDGDVRRTLLDGHGLQADISLIKTISPVTVSQDTPFEEIYHMFSNKIRAIPIIDSSDNVVDVFLSDQRAHLPVASPLFDDEEIRLVTDCIVSGWVSSGGPFVSRFEQAMAKFCNVKYAVSCSSCTTGLHLALLSLNIGVGDEVIVPSLTFISTANAVAYTGAKPILIDSEPNTWNLDISKIEKAINEKTKAIIVVHLYGHPVDMDHVNKISKKYNLKVIEDAAEAQGAKYKNRIVGSLGDVAVFSFFGNKIITTGEGGMVVTDDKTIADKCRVLRDHGMPPDKRYWHEVVGYNYRMTNLQAALGVAQMNKINNIIVRKRQIFDEYNKYLTPVAGIELPPNAEWAEPVCWLYTILVDFIDVSIDQLADKLRESGVETRPVFPPIHTQPIYKNNQTLPISEKISAIGISLPSSIDLTTKEIMRICSIIDEFCSEFNLSPK